MTSPPDNDETEEQKRRRKHAEEERRRYAKMIEQETPTQKKERQRKRSEAAKRRLADPVNNAIQKLHQKASIARKVVDPVKKQRKLAAIEAELTPLLAKREQAKRERAKRGEQEVPEWTGPWRHGPSSQTASHAPEVVDLTNTDDERGSSDDERGGEEEWGGETGTPSAPLLPDLRLRSGADFQPDLDSPGAEGSSGYGTSRVGSATPQHLSGSAYPGSPALWAGHRPQNRSPGFFPGSPPVWAGVGPNLGDDLDLGAGGTWRDEIDNFYAAGQGNRAGATPAQGWGSGLEQDMPEEDREDLLSGLGSGFFRTPDNSWATSGGYHSRPAPRLSQEQRRMLALEEAQERAAARNPQTQHQHYPQQNFPQQFHQPGYYLPGGPLPPAQPSQYYPPQNYPSQYYRPGSAGPGNTDERRARIAAERQVTRDNQGLGNQDSYRGRDY